MDNSLLARKRNKRFRIRLSLAGPPLVRSYPWQNQTRQYLARLRDADADQDGISTIGSIQDSLPPSFDATNGATGDGTSKAVQLNTSSINAALNAGGRISFEVPLSLIDSYPTATEYFISKSGGWTEFRESIHGYLRTKFPESGDAARVYTDAGVRDGVDTSTHVEIACAWDGSNIWMEVDKLPFSTTRSAPGADSAFNAVYLVGLSGTAATGDGLTMRNAQIFTGAPNYTANPDYGKIVFFGDSFLRQGALSSTQVANATIDWDPGYGFDSGGAPSSGGNYTSDCGLIAAFMRECYRGGLQPGSSNHNDGEGGDNILACKSRVQTWFTSNTAQVAVISIGANDIGSATPMTAQEKIDNEADYKTIIDECTAGGCNRIVINKVASLRNDATYQTSAHDSDIDWWNNTLVPLMEQYNNRVVIADCFTAMGGLTPDSTLFQSGNLHPNSKGQHKYGKTLGEALMASFSG